MITIYELMFYKQSRFLQRFEIFLRNHLTRLSHRQWAQTNSRQVIWQVCMEVDYAISTGTPTNARMLCSAYKYVEADRMQLQQDG